MLGETNFPPFRLTVLHPSQTKQREMVKPYFFVTPVMVNEKYERKGGHLCTSKVVRNYIGAM